MLPAYDALLILEEGRDIIASQRFDQPVHKHAPDESDGSVTDGLWNLKYGLRDAIANNSSYSIRRQILQRIRTVEGSGQIGTALTAAAIKRLAKGGPIAVINITTVRSDAIIITTSDIISMELPRLDQDSISDLSWKIQRGLAKERPRDRKETARKLRLRITEMLDIIWRSVTKPVLDYLGYKFRDDDVQEWPRVCWVPTGILTLYPIHAAGLGLGEPGNVFNRVVSTYATSLKQLLRKDAQKKSRAQETPSNGPLAAVPDPDPWPVLEQSNNEAAVVKTYFPNATIIKQPRAASVLSLLSQSPSLVHFSCHGHVDYIDPSKSLLLFEEQISVASIQELNLRSNAAFLSACFTANSGYEGLQDEPNHMTASLLDAGFDSVIGSLWYVDQEDAPVFTEVYYKYLAGHCDAKIKPRVVAEAFHVAMLEVAKSTRKESNRDIGDPLHWAPFICYGA
ncbi:CHAT domain-containing protein [Phaeosphaeriaceae sp. PMI808]|nr:CHAT domain-containing protein [Phaeosphaeriaceae sp. PMI808]